jgi:hypothetical protein
MDLRGYANQASNAVNNNIVVAWLASTGYSMGTAGRQQPRYGAAVTGPAQVQALDGDTLRHLDKMNIQGTIRALYMYGSLANVIRPDSRGGDLIVIGAQSGAPPELQGQWLVIKALESWPSWTKVAILKQATGAQ